MYEKTGNLYRRTGLRGNGRRAGSGSTLRAAYELGRHSYGFEVDRKFYTAATERMLTGATVEADEGQVRMEELL